MAPETYTFRDDGAIPNSVLPALVYRFVDAAHSAPDCEQLFARHGWHGAWRNGIYPFHHFHSISHEVLGIVAGSVTVMLGGAAGKARELAQGDVAILPAGLGHCNVGEDELLVIGAYPNGMRWDLRRGDPDEHNEVMANIARVPLPETDPVFGEAGPLVGLWGARWLGS